MGCGTVNDQNTLGFRVVLRAGNNPRFCIGTRKAGLSGDNCGLLAWCITGSSAAESGRLKALKIFLARDLLCASMTWYVTAGSKAQQGRQKAPRVFLASHCFAFL